MIFYKKETEKKYLVARPAVVLEGVGDQKVHHFLVAMGGSD